MIENNNVHGRIGVTTSAHRMNTFMDEPMSIKFALTGVHGSGKTTLLREIEKALDDRGITYVTVREVARGCPFPIGSEATFEAQAWIFSEQMRQELYVSDPYVDVILLDRTMLDNIMYMRHLRGNNDETTRWMHATAAVWMSSYDIVVWLPLNLEWVLMRDHHTGTTEEITEFAESIDKLFNAFMFQYADMRCYDVPTASEVADLIEEKIYETTE